MTISLTATDSHLYTGQGISMLKVSDFSLFCIVLYGIKVLIISRGHALQMLLQYYHLTIDLSKLSSRDWTVLSAVHWRLYGISL